MGEKIEKVLIIDDDEDILLAAKMFLKKHVKHVIIEQNPQKIPFLLNNDTYDVILLDMNFSEDTTSGKEGFHWLGEILNREPKAVVIMITAFGDVETAVKALKEGATDFVLKPWQNEKLLATISAAAKLSASYEEVKKLKKTNRQLLDDISGHTDYDMLGESAGIKNVRSIIDKVAQTAANVLILGVNGTGKELVARAIHRNSMRSDKVFVGVDMGAISETLFESELFGHKKGAFTDAKEDRTGRFEVANAGTLFLDEIGNLPLTHQAKLLAVLQNREIVQLGSNKVVPIDIRLICATNMPLYEMVEDNQFRQDLLYRINTVEIHIPPLRERLGDVPALAKFFVGKYAKKYKKMGFKISSDAIGRLQMHHWPGNIRELQHAIERVVIMNESDTVQANDFFFLSTKKADQTISVQGINLNLDEMEKVAIEKAIQKHNGNISKAAKELGLTRASLYRRLEK
ncbi:MAG: sigma-54 dependent transcriptional regulator, partial [Bacteroidota bacterium]